MGDLFAAAGAGRKTPAKPDPPLPTGLDIESACEPGDSRVAQELQAAASARVPLVAGLTLSSTWVRDNEGGFEHECLHQITGVDNRGISTTHSCDYRDGTRHGVTRVICAKDFDAARYYHPSWYYPRYPEAVRGSVMFTLPLQAFHDLQARGGTRHQLVDINTNQTPSIVHVDYTGTIERQQETTMRVIVNDRPVDLPVIAVSGRMSGSGYAKHDMTVHATVLDDARFPMVLEYSYPEIHYSLTYTKISFPSATTLERQLEQDEPVDVYGIYFDFASDRLRPESGAVLDEIAQVLRRHPDWKLRVAGHTDNIGGATSNLDLSKRRAAAVRDALETRYGINGSRLTTTGYGLSSPKDTNDTPEGRARNRRVELTRER